MISNVKQGGDNLSSYVVVSVWWRHGEEPRECRPGLCLFVKIIGFAKRKLEAKEVLEVLASQSLDVAGIAVRVRCRATTSPVSIVSYSDGIL
jgi:hypothetical protein